jgi:hypothetical protein
MTLNPIDRSVGQCFTVPSAAQGHERLHSSTYNRASVLLFHDFRKRAGAATISDWECMESAAPTDCFFADLDAHRQVIGSERHLQIQAFFTRNTSRASARADQFQHGVHSIEQW